MSDPVRHIQVGGGNKTWCGEKLPKTHKERRQEIAAGRMLAPLTEGEYIDDDGFIDVCGDCSEALERVRS